jgi:hypothetical protein
VVKSNHFKTAKIMKKTLLILVTLVTISSCTKKVDLNLSNIWGVTSDKNIYFTLNINGKTISSYGAKFSNSLYQDLALDFLYATTSTYTDFNNNLITETTLMVDPLYQEIWNWGQFGLKDGEVIADINLIKNGTILGVHQLEDFFGNTIIDKTNGNIEYQIVATGSSVTITEVTQEIIKGNMNLRLKLGNQTIPASGTFRLLRFN